MNSICDDIWWPVYGSLRRTLRIERPHVTRLGATTWTVLPIERFLNPVFILNGRQGLMSASVA
jgi:hypothetical protein